MAELINVITPDAPFRAGERVLLVDDRRRTLMVELKVGTKSSTHNGSVAHDDIIDQLTGIKVLSTKGKMFRIMRPTLSESIEAMPRGAQVIYPKDLAQILMMGDIRPGHRVMESGVGSGALSMALLNMGAQVVGYEIREDFANRARNNVALNLGTEALSRYSVILADVYLGVGDELFDRVILDLPEPWRVLEHLHGKLRRGGILIAYQTSVGQLAQFRAELENQGFFLAQTKEVLVRDWYYSSMALRPDHRMVAHTGFLTMARIGAKPVRSESPGSVSLIDLDQ